MAGNSDKTILHCLDRSTMVETIAEQYSLPGDDTDHTSAVFDGERDVVLYRGCGYKVSGMNTHYIPMAL